MCWPTAATSRARRLLACEALDVIPYVPRPLTSGAKADGRFGKQDFVYIPEQDVYRCPAEVAGPPHDHRRKHLAVSSSTLFGNRSSCRRY